MPNVSRVTSDISIAINDYLSHLESERDAAMDMALQSEPGTRNRKAAGNYGPIQDERRRNVAEPNAYVGGTKSGGRKVSKTSTALVRPDDITDAVDANDLLAQFLDRNMDTIKDKREDRLRLDWVDGESRAIRQQYQDRASVAYEKMWHECSKTKVGHAFNRIDVSGHSIDRCNVCSFHLGHNSYGSDSNTRLATEMNNGVIRTMSEKMIELDENAAILTWPKPEDMPQRELKRRLKGKK